MATACNNNDLNEFVTCGVCLKQFDDKRRIPKFLPCTHTMCYICIKEIWRVGKVLCPFCQKTSLHADCQNIPINNYALHMVKLHEQTVPAASSANSMGVNWCFTCGSVAKGGCMSYEHSFVNVTTETIKNLEAFVRLKEELRKIKNQAVDKLAKAMVKRKLVEKHLNYLIKSVEATMDEIHQLHDGNNLLMAELVSILERGVHLPMDSKNSPIETKDYFLSELKSLTEDATPDDTAETLKEKLIKSVEMSEEKLREAEAIASEFDNFQRMKITVSLTDEENHFLPTVPWLQDGFRLVKVDGSHGLIGVGRAERRKLFLLSHIIFSLVRNQSAVFQESVVCPTSTDVSSVQVKVSTPSVSIAPNSQLQLNTACSSSESKPSGNSPKNIVPPISSRLGITFPSASHVTLPPTVPAACNFVIGQSQFILKLYHFGVLKGEIQICPVPTFHPDFVKLLGDFCYESPKVFCQKISKAVPDMFVLLPMTHLDFKPAVPGMIPSSASSLPANKAYRTDDVGVNLIKASVCGTMVSGWSFIFPLQNFAAPKQAVHVRNLVASELFGHVVHPELLEPITKLASLNNAVRVGYTLTLESK